MKKHAIYDWSKFRESELYLQILLRWSNLLKDENLTEKEYHNFLFSHPSMFFTGLDSYIVISKLKLGSDYETDFVVVNEGYSN